MESTGGARTLRSALVAVTPPRALGLARSFGEAGFAPTLAFTAEQLEGFGGAFDVIVADDQVDHAADTLCRAGSGDVTVRMFVSHELHARPEVHALLPCDVSPRELVDRACTLLALRGERATNRVITWGPLSIDFGRRDARWRGTPLRLTPTQFRIAAALVQARGAVLTKLELQHEVWPNSPPDSGERLVAHIRRMRGKLEVDPSHPQFLLTARGEGFRLADPATEAFGDWDGIDRRLLDRRRPPFTPQRTESA
jgi:DNA-binding response OmpR family regulator